MFALKMASRSRIGMRACSIFATPAAAFCKGRPEPNRMRSGPDLGDNLCDRLEALDAGCLQVHRRKSPHQCEAASQLVEIVQTRENPWRARVTLDQRHRWCRGRASAYPSSSELAAAAAPGRRRGCFLAQFINEWLVQRMVGVELRSEADATNIRAVRRGEKDSRRACGSVPAADAGECARSVREGGRPRWPPHCRPASSRRNCGWSK